MPAMKKTVTPLLPFKEISGAMGLQAWHRPSTDNSSVEDSNNET